MMKYLRFIAAALFFVASPVLAQTSGTVTNHAFAIGKGAGTTGYTSLLCGSAQLAVGQSAADPICRTITGDVTIDVAGATAIGTAKVTSAMLRNSAALSVIGRSANSTGVPADITCTAASDAVLRESGSVLGCGTIATGGIANNAVTNAKLATMAAYTFKGNNTGSTAAPTDVDIAALTTKGSPAAGDFVMISDQAAAGAWKKAAVSTIGGGAGVTSLNGDNGAVVLWGPPQGRLTLTSNTPVMATSVTAATTVYYTSTAAGKNIPVYNGTNVVVRQLCAANTTGACELSAVLGANWTTNSNYDWFVGLDGATLRLCSGPDWAAGAVAGSNAVGASTRGTGAGSTDLENFDGLLTNKNSMTCRYANASTFTCAAHQCTFVGSSRTGSAGQVSFTYGGSSTAANLYLWNAYNKEQICTTVYDSTSSWTYLTATIRQARATTTNQINFMTGGASGSIDASYSTLIRPAASVGALGYIGIALNSTTVLDKQAQLINVTTNTLNVPAIAANTYGGVLGANYISANENGDGATTTTYFGNLYFTLRACMGM